MGLGRLGRRIGAAVGRRVGMKVRKYVAPVLPFVLTPVAVGAGLSAGALALFFNIADDVREQDGVWRFDHDGLRLALSLRNPRRTALMRTVSAFARPDVMTGIGLLSLVLSSRSPAHRSKGVTLAVALAGGGGIIGVIKHNFARERPTLIEALASEATFSFPSGHSFIALCFYGILASWWMRVHPHWSERFLIATTSTGAIALIGASRVYLGVHYPSDVLAGYAAAVPWLTACLTANVQYEKRVALLPQSPRRLQIAARETCQEKDKPC
jgi:membrane-associated phospholipid phosphatase